MRDTLMNAFKFIANATLAMLCVATIFSSCNFEEETLTPSGAKALLMTDADSLMRLGHTEVTWEGTATTAEKVVIDGVAAYDYDGIPVVYVEQLGLPVYLVGEPIFDGDKVTYSFSDGEVINRDFSFTSTTGVKGTSTSSWLKTIILGQLNDSTELCEAQFNEAWAIWTDLLPAALESSKSGNYVPRVLYKRIVKQALPAPEPITYRRVLTLDLEAASEGLAGGTMLVEQVQGDAVIDSWSCYGVMAEWGTYKPQVSAQSVLSLDFTTHDLLGVAADLGADLPGLGTKGTFTRKNTRHTREAFEVRFTSNPDAEGSTVRPIRGQLDVWVYEFVFVNPADDHKENFTVEVEVVSTKSKVNTATNTYERTVEVRINGEVVDVQNGSVQLNLVQ